MDQQVKVDERARRDEAFARLVSLRRLIRTMLVLDKVGWLVAGVIAAALVVGAIDFGVRLPAAVRTGLLVAGIAAAAWYWMTRVRPAARFRPGLEELALRVERSRGVDGVAGVLASGVGLVGDESGSAVVERAKAALGRVPVSRVLNWRRPAAAGLTAMVAGGAVAAMLAYAPLTTLMGARRVLTPWSGAQWPKRTGVRDITGVTVHPLGSALSLRAALVKGDPAKGARVTVRYRVGGGETREQALSAQGRDVTLPLEAIGEGESGPVRGALLETLLEPGALAAGTQDGTAEGELEYWFVSADDRTETAKIRLVPPPAVLGAEVRITPPEYVGEKDQRVLEAGPGTDQRATVTGVLAGSRVELTLRLNKPVRGMAGEADRVPWLRSTLGEHGAALAGESDTTLSLEPTVWRIGWTVRSTVRLTPHPVDLDGVEPSVESVYRVEVREDRPPEAVVVQPAQDVEVLATAVVPVSGEGRDDVGVKWAALEYVIASPKAGSASSEVEAAPGDPVVLARAEGAGRSASVGGQLELGNLKVSAGQEVWVTAVAADAYSVDGRTHEPARSAVRRVRVISPEKMIEQVWNELGGVRRAAVKATEQQDALTERTRKGADGLARPQEDLTEAIARMSKTAAELSKRARDNGLVDEDLEAVLSQARSLAEQAKEASTEAAEAARESDEAKARGDARARKSAQDRSAAAQDKAARALEQLAESLDRGQDAWSTTRAVQRLIDEQAALRQQTGELGEKTVGKSEEELTSAERQKIAELAEKQEQLARRTDDQLKKLRERAQQMKQTDPAGAQAMEDAARKGQQSGASEQMQQAAQQIQRNQQQTAGQQQQQAQKGLEQVLDQLKQNAKSRDATLRRQMASLIETLNRLIAVQERELARATTAAAAGAVDAPYKGLDDPMVKLHTQTLGAVGQAREAGKEARHAVTLLTDAAEAQQLAVVALRASPVDGPVVVEKERESLEKLTAARDEAQQQQDQAAKRDQDRKRAELKQKYQAMLTEQGAVRAEGADLIGKELDRRARSRARGLADREESIADQASLLMKETKELQGADLFVLAHDRVDALSRGAAEGLREETIGETVTLKQRGVERVLRQIIEALDDSKSDEEDFREPESGSGGGQQGGAGQDPPLVPPAAEVKLLKLMQQEALGLTREADEAQSAGAAAEAQKLQRALAERGALLLKKMQNPGGGQ
ncbi:MAG TPA: hypothetical protein VEB22_02265 [Phycisphaerales bacterium]|nr:hypothetical protein [Phycisphaerales bacterium]